MTTVTIDCWPEVLKFQLFQKVPPLQGISTSSALQINGLPEFDLLNL